MLEPSSAITHPRSAGHAPALSDALELRQDHGVELQAFRLENGHHLHAIGDLVRPWRTAREPGIQLSEVVIVPPLSSASSKRKKTSDIVSFDRSREEWQDRRAAARCLNSVRNGVRPACATAAERISPVRIARARASGESAAILAGSFNSSRMVCLVRFRRGQTDLRAIAHTKGHEAGEPGRPIAT